MSNTERIRDPNTDSGDEDDFVAPTHDAIQVYNKFKDTDFTAGPRKSGDERNEWEANKNLFAKALSTVREKVIANTKVLLCTHPKCLEEISEYYQISFTHRRNH